MALIGIIMIQVQQISRTIALNQTNFDMNVSDALMDVVDQLEESELVTRFIKVSRAFEVESRGGFADTANSVYLSLDEDMETPKVKSKQVRIRDSLAIITERLTQVPYDTNLNEGRSTTYMYFFDDSSRVAEDMAVELRGHPRMVQLVSSALKGSGPSNISIEKRTSQQQLDSLLQDALLAQGLELTYDFWVESEGSENYPIQKISHSSKSRLESKHGIQLYPYSSTGQKAMLKVWFPNENIFALKKVWGQMLLSLLFVGIILVCFGVVIQVVFRQKKLSEMKNDFINNMTHELKTPIATISLATDAIDNPKVRSSNESIDRYTRIIKEENSRMNRQVERVLLAAKLDRKEMELRMGEVDMHEVISKAVRNARIQVNNRGGKVELDCQAQDHRIKGDAVHLTNVIYNLLDNANKYSPENPLIQVRTFNEEDRLLIEVEDNGIGISKQNLQQIFTRFYRVSTGNLHEVKGFGLGLNYVKDITEAHGGEVGVRSVLDKGSTFYLSLPLNDNS